MSEKTVKIETRDRELYEMTALWLSDDGYEVTEKDDADIVIVDTETVTASREGKDSKIIYITETAKDKNSLERPFSRLEFLSLVRGRSGEQELSIRVDQKRRRVYYKKVYVSLTDKEYEIFRMLYDSVGETVSRDEISAVARGGEQKTNAADVYICMLRRKLTELFGENPIKTVRGHGYLLSLDKRK